MDITVLNTDFQAVAIIDEYESLIWTDRYDSYGDFELVLPMNVGLLDILKEDYYLRIKDSEHCMIIEDRAIDSDSENGNRLKVTGRSLESILDRRIVWGTEYEYGNLQNFIARLIDLNIADSEKNEQQERKIDNFVFERSEDIKITGIRLPDIQQHTGEDLYTIIAELCKEYHIGFKIILTDDCKFVFSLYAGIDHSYSQNEESRNPYVVFSPEYDNIINSNYYSSKADFKNVTLIAGEGNGPSRKTKTMHLGSGVPSGLNRREIFTDARDVSSKTGKKDADGNEQIMSTQQYEALLITKGQKTLNENGRKTAFEGEADAKGLFKYHEDFDIGDIVQIADAYGNNAAAYISELVISYSANEQSVYPTFKAVDDSN